MSVPPCPPDLSFLSKPDSAFLVAGVHCATSCLSPESPGCLLCGNKAQASPTHFPSPRAALGKAVPAARKEARARSTEQRSCRWQAFQTLGGRKLEASVIRLCVNGDAGRNKALPGSSPDNGTANSTHVPVSPSQALLDESFRSSCSERVWPGHAELLPGTGPCRGSGSHVGQRKPNALCWPRPGRPPPPAIFSCTD